MRKLSEPFIGWFNRISISVWLIQRLFKFLVWQEVGAHGKQLACGEMWAYSNPCLINSLRRTLRRQVEQEHDNRRVLMTWDVIYGS